jgi:hypothetical protein
MPPTRFDEGSEAEARELVEWAEAYGALHQDTFGGAWFTYVNDRPRTLASFTGDLAAHAAALDPRIRVVATERSTGALETALEALRALGEEHEPTVQMRTAQADIERSQVLCIAETDDEDGFERAVRARLGDVVDLYFARYGRANTTIEDWEVDDTGTTITASWTGGWDEREQGLDADERGDEVHLTAWSITEISLERAKSSTGPGLTFMNAAVGYSREASVTLSRPLGDRRVLDDQRDRIDDHPPIDRPDDVDLLFDAGEFVDGLDWAEYRGCMGPGENGWMRIYATVDDTERLRAALDERFGGGFEVEFQAPYDASDDSDDSDDSDKIHG